MKVIARNSCSECRRLTVEAQRPSLVNAVGWLHHFAFESNGAQPPNPGEMVLSRFTPCCEELSCPSAPRRDATLAAAATARVQATFAPPCRESPALKVRLLESGLRWAMRAAVVPETASLSLGPAAAHSALVANNLIQAAQPAAASSPAVMPGDLALASESSMAELERLAQSSNPLRPEFSAGDVIAIRVLRRGLDGLFAFASAYRDPAPLVSWVRPWKAILALGALGLLLIAAGYGGESVVVSVLGGLALLSAVFLLPAQKVVTPVHGLAWVQRLRGWSALPAHRDLRARLVRCDFLGVASNQFAGSPWAEPDCAAATLRALHGTAGAELLLPQVASALVQSATDGAMASPSSGVPPPSPSVLWLGLLGEYLLAHDGLSRGSDVAGLLLAELLNAVPSRADQSPIWSILATEGELTDGPTVPDSGETSATTPPAMVASMPRLFARLLRRAAALRDGRKAWSSREGVFMERLGQAARELLGGPAQGSLAAHFMVVRVLRCLLERGRDGAALPLDAGCTVESLCRRVENIHAAYPRQEDTEAIRAECEAVIAMPGFVASSRGPWVQSPREAAQWSPGRRSGLDVLVGQWGSGSTVGMPTFGRSWGDGGDGGRGPQKVGDPVGDDEPKPPPLAGAAGLVPKPKIPPKGPIGAEKKATPSKPKKNAGKKKH